MTPDRGNGGGGRDAGNGDGRNGRYADWLRRRKDAYSRYASLLSDQLEALDAGDIERVSELSDERDEIAAILEDQEDEDLPPAPEDPGEETRALASDVRSRLERCVELDADVRERLKKIRDETLDAIRTSRDREEEARAYIRAEERTPRNPYASTDSEPDADDGAGDDAPRHIDVTG